MRKERAVKDVMVVPSVCYKYTGRGIKVSTTDMCRATLHIGQPKKCWKDSFLTHGVTRVDRSIQ